MESSRIYLHMRAGSADRQKKEAEDTGTDRLLWPHRCFATFF